jgi:hypothetical protein
VTLFLAVFVLGLLIGGTLFGDQERAESRRIRDENTRLRAEVAQCKALHTNE